MVVSFLCSLQHLTLHPPTILAHNHEKTLPYDQHPDQILCFDAVHRTLQVGSILNFSLMYVLAPTAAGSAATSQLSRIISGAPLAACGAPGISLPQGPNPSDFAGLCHFKYSTARMGGLRFLKIKCLFQAATCFRAARTACPPGY